MSAPLLPIPAIRRHLFEGSKSVFGDQVTWGLVDVVFGWNEQLGSRNIQLAKFVDVSLGVQALTGSLPGVYELEVPFVTLFEVRDKHEFMDSEEFLWEMMHKFLEYFVTDPSSPGYIASVFPATDYLDLGVVSTDTYQEASRCVSRGSVEILWKGRNQDV